jgi:flagellar motor switch/type III secretory pathway protein FliN
MSLARALRLTAAKQADRLMGLPLSALSVTRRAISGEDVSSSLEVSSLMLLMDGAGDQVAAAVLDPVLVTGLIQQQTMGKVMPPPEGGETRRHTATDAALCAPFIEKLLSGAALLPDTPDECALLNGYRFGVWAREPRQAQLALDASEYVLVEMTLDMAAGTRAGKLMLLLPQSKRVVVPVEQGGDTVAKAISTANLAENVLGLTADLMIGLTRIKMPLQEVSGLKVGDMLDLNLSSMAHALVIDGNGRALARGTLGQIDGWRAVQVEQRNDRKHTKPRRRASDRDGLDLPDVTAPQPGGEGLEDVGLPSLADMDVFGNLDDLPELPDMEEAAQAADSQMADWNAAQGSREDDDDTKRQNQAGW